MSTFRRRALSAPLVSPEGDGETGNLKRTIDDMPHVVKVADILGIKLPVRLEGDQSKLPKPQTDEERPLVDYRRVRANRVQWKRVLRSAGYEPLLAMGHHTLSSTQHPSLNEKKVSTLKM